MVDKTFCDICGAEIDTYDFGQIQCRGLRRKFKSGYVVICSPDCGIKHFESMKGIHQPNERLERLKKIVNRWAVNRRS